MLCTDINMWNSENRNYLSNRSYAVFTMLFEDINILMSEYSVLVFWYELMNSDVFSIA